MYSARFQTLAELIRRRLAGSSVGITAWTDRPGGWWEPDDERRGTAARSADQIRWGEWLGKGRSPPEFDPQLHPGAWRHSLDHGTGALGDMGPHLLALPFVGLDLADATLQGVEVVASARSSPRRFPEEAHIRFLLSAPGPAEVSLNWPHGGQLPTAIDGVRVPGNGCLIAAEGQGVVIFDWDPSDAFAISDGSTERIDLPPQGGRSSIGAWHDAIGAGDRTPTDFMTFGIPLTRLVLTGCDTMHRNSGS